MFSIGQFSKICQVSTKTLHHYDKIQLLTPCRVDPWTGYRYYNEGQISTLLLIQRLKRYGFSLNDIKELLSQNNSRVLFSKLEQQRNLLKDQIEATSLILKEMERHLISFERTGDITGYQNDYTIQLKEAAEIPVISSRQMMSTNDFGVYFGKIFETIAREHLTIAGQTISIYHDEEFNQENTDIEVAVAIAEKDKATRIIPSSLCAVTIHRGAYSSLGDAYGAILKWCSQNGYELADAPYEIYIKSGMGNNLPVEKWETEVYFPVRKS